MPLSYRNVLNRRTFLRGAGGVAIGLPLLEEMRPNSLWGADPEPPVRCFTLCFGLGIPPEQVAERFNGPLQPLQPFADKLAFFTNINAGREGGVNGATAHTAGGTTVFTGIGGKREAHFGPSVDFVVKKGAYPNGTPTPIGILSTASYFRRNGYFKRYRSFDEDGTRTVEAHENPEDTFKAVFGDFMQPDPNAAPDPEAERHWRLERSVLDTVFEQYKHYTSEASPLGAASIARVKDHLERIRELEQRVFPAEGTANDPNISCSAPQKPVAPDLPYGIEGGESGEAPLVAAADFQAAYRLNSELAVMAARCDLVRFATFQFEAPGGHTRFEGTYEFGGKTYQFNPEQSQHDAWHDSRMDDVWHNARYIQSNMAYTLELLNDPTYLDENGQTLLENALTVLGTETGWNHDQNGVFHACSSANGRLNVGKFYDQDISSVDFYTTIVRPYDPRRVLGTERYFGGEVSGLLA